MAKGKDVEQVTQQETDKANQKRAVTGKREGNVPDPAKRHGDEQSIPQTHLLYPTMQSETQSKHQQRKNEPFGGVVDTFPLLGLPANLTPRQFGKAKSRGCKEGENHSDKGRVQTLISPHGRLLRRSVFHA